MTEKERRRREEQSKRANPIKWQKKMLSKGCCKNCIHNVKRRGDTFTSLGGVPVRSATKQVCECSGNTIINEFVTCNKYKRNR